jgi:hypothetical protein
MNIKKPKSWYEAECLPFVSHILRGSTNITKDGEPNIWVELKSHVPNPVTGSLGGGFYCLSFNDFKDHYWESSNIYIYEH